MSINLETARSITAGVRVAGKDHGLKPLTVAVLDAGGHVVSVEREACASFPAHAYSVEDVVG